MVRETTEQVIERVRDFRRSVLLGSVAGASPAEESASHPLAEKALAPKVGYEGSERG